MTSHVYLVFRGLLRQKLTCSGQVEVFPVLSIFLGEVGTPVQKGKDRREDKV